MKRGAGLLIFGIFILLLLCLFVHAASDSMSVEVNVYAPSVSLSVPDRIAFGNLTKGYDSDQVDFLIYNTGTSNIKITAELENSSDNIFRYLYLWGSSISQKRIENFTINISAPSAYGGSESKTIYSKLKLSEFNGTISSDLIGYKDNVIFWATAY